MTTPSGQDDHAEPFSVDEILANPMKAIDIPDGAIPVHAIVIIEYANPGADYRPELGRLGWCADTTNSLWNELGMLEFATIRVQQSITQLDGDFDDGTTP